MCWACATTGQYWMTDYRREEELESFSLTLDIVIRYKLCIMCITFITQVVAGSMKYLAQGAACIPHLDEFNNGIKII